jgi:hypothetical protein
VNWRRTARLSTVPLALAFASAALAQAPADPVAQLNKALVAPGVKDASDTLLTSVATMDAPPKLPKAFREVSLMTSKSRSWADWDAWAKADPQQAALTALKTVCDPKSKYALGLPYGRSNTKPEWVAAGIAIDVGEPPLLAAAPNGLEYLDRLGHVALLCTVQAERLALENKPAECVAVLLDWLRLGRMIADRPFAAEKLWGLAQMTKAVERLGDIACSHPDLLTEKVVQDTNKDLDFRAIAPERIRFPVGERMALDQLIALAIEERGGPKPGGFGPTLARITYDRTNPYDLFPQAAYWGEIGKSHAGWFDTREQVDRVLGDWQKRWELNDIFDPIMQTPTDYSRMDRLRFAMIEQMVRPAGELFALRTTFVTQLGGLRSALAVVGYRSVQKQWPPNLNAVQPRFVQKLDYDPWFFEREREVREIYRYFVPMRDMPVGPRDLPKPHAITVAYTTSSAAGAVPHTAGLPAFPEGVLPSEVAAQAQQRAAEAMRMLNTAPAGMIDVEALTIDVTKFRRWLLEINQSQTDEADAQELTDTLKRIAESGVTAENVEQRIREVFGQVSPGVGSMESTDAEKPPFDVEKVQRALIDAATALLSDPTISKSIESAKAGKALTVEEAKACLEAAFTAAIQPAHIDPLLEAGRTLVAGPIGESIKQSLRDAIAAAATMASQPAEGPPPFAISLTDKDFILYSVGPNLKPEFAKNVSPVGPDILVWPPVLTLERRAQSSN